VDNFSGNHTGLRWATGIFVPEMMFLWNYWDVMGRS